VGGYPDASGVWQSFLWERDGSITYLPSAGVPGPNSFTYMLSINNSGLVVGFAGSDTIRWQPTLYENGKYTFLQIPGAYDGVAWGVNDRGQVAGYYLDNSGALHNFVKTGDNYAIYDLEANFTAINNRGQIVGLFYDPTGTQHGLFFDHGVTTLVDPPGSVATWLYAINDHGQAVGFYFDQAGLAHAFEVNIGNTN
jgi:uncharacterized membrane protein